MQKLYAIVTLLSIISATFALQCYVCNSLNDIRCLNLSNSTLTVTFSDLLQECGIDHHSPEIRKRKSYICRKISYTMDGGPDRILRNCSSYIDKENHRRRWKTFRSLREYRTQYYIDGRNDAFPTERSSGLAILSTVFTIFIAEILGS
ncbi:hypothetical protein DMENIID0001_063820 [Sergentomyia squamirostris]